MMIGELKGSWKVLVEFSKLSEIQKKFHLKLQKIKQEKGEIK
jgi:hypothetical protein